MLLHFLLVSNRICCPGREGLEISTQESKTLELRYTSNAYGWPSVSYTEFYMGGQSTVDQNILKNSEVPKAKLELGDVGIIAW